MGDPKRNKNYRNNPSLLISHRNSDDGASSSASSPLRNVIIDVGKTFREGALRWMPHHGIYHIDGIVLTHEHADAILGLDDLRGFQIAPYMNIIKGNKQSASLPVFLSPLCLETVRQVFFYLVPKELKEKEKVKDKLEDVKVVRHVASLDFQTVQFFEPFYAAGLKMIPLPVKHGEDFICNGYAFSVNGDKGKTINVVYLSDISRMIPETEKYIMEELPPTDILVVDTLNYSGRHSVHYSLDQALELVKRLKAKKTFLVGMNCDNFPEHDEANRLIQERDSTVELAHDGLAIEI
jgi:phosphoribosyl 1,2-cyclic phosphodiesterase